MDQDTFEFEESRVYRIKKNGVQVILDEEDMKNLLNRKEVRRIWSAGVQLAPTPSQPPSQPKSEVPWYNTRTSKPNTEIPTGFERLHEAPCDPRSPYEKRFVYYRNDNSGEYGFLSKENDGTLSRFSKIGTISNQRSKLGSFVRVMPHDREKYYAKSDLAKMGIPLTNNGRNLKAVLDILTFEGYLESKPLIDKTGRIGYRRTEKMDGLLEDLRNNELRKVHSYPPTIPSH